MSTRDISISEDAYEVLNAAREEGETYSEVIERLAAEEDDITRFAGAFPEIGAVADDLATERKRFSTREVEEP